jgi:hypothetical protein
VTDPIERVGGSKRKIEAPMVCQHRGFFRMWISNQAQIKCETNEPKVVGRVAQKSIAKLLLLSNLRNERPAPITQVKGADQSLLQLLRTGILAVVAAGFPDLYSVENQR